MSWVWEHSPVGGSELLVLLAIADCASDDGTRAWPSVATLARKCRIDSRTVQRIIRRLSEAGHLLVEATAGGRGSNRYAVVMSSPEELSTAPGNLPPRQSATGDTATPPQPRQDAGAPPAQPCHPNILEPPLKPQRARGAANPPPRGARRCPRHAGQLAKSCGPCRADQLAGA